MSAKFKTEHYEMVLKAGDMERCLPTLAWHLEEPRVGQKAIQTLCRQISQQIRQGSPFRSRWGRVIRRLPVAILQALKNQDFDHYVDQYYDFWQRLIPSEVVKKVFAPIWDEVETVRTREVFKDVFTNHENQLNSAEDYLNHSLYFEAKTFLHGLFVVEDKISMAHSLETRVPLWTTTWLILRCGVGRS